VIVLVKLGSPNPLTDWYSVYFLQTTRAGIVAQFFFIFRSQDLWVTLNHSTAAAVTPRDSHNLGTLNHEYEALVFRARKEHLGLGLLVALSGLSENTRLFAEDIFTTSQLFTRQSVRVKIQHCQIH